MTLIPTENILYRKRNESLLEYCINNYKKENLVRVKGIS